MRVNIKTTKCKVDDKLVTERYAFDSEYQCSVLFATEEGIESAPNSLRQLLPL